MDTFTPTRQRPALLTLAAALDSREAAFRRDECGDWRIGGKRGHVYADAPDSFVIVVATMSALSWNLAKTTLSPFATLTQEGDRDGVFILDRFPSADEAAVILKTLRIPRRRHLSDEHREKLRETGYRARETA